MKPTSSTTPANSSSRSTARSTTSSPTRTNARRQPGAPPATKCAACRATTSSADDAALAQQREDGFDRGERVAGLEPQVRRRRRLVGIVDPGHTADLTRAGARIEALGIALFTHLERRVDEHLEEVQTDVLVDLPGQLAVGRIRT